MPLFYFHLRFDERLSRDELGLELVGLEAAYLEACRAIPEMTRDCARRNAPRPCAFEIADADGRLLLEVPFSEVLDRRPARLAPPTLRRRVRAEMARAQQLRTALDQQLAALQATIRTTQALVARSQMVCRPAWAAPNGQSTGQPPGPPPTSAPQPTSGS